MKRIICFLIASVFVFLYSITIFAAENDSTKTPNYDKTNSFQAVVKVDKKTEFTPKDFPQIPCTELYVADMSKGDNGYFYTLIFVCEGAQDIEAERQKMMGLPNISFLRENEYITVREKSVLRLSDSKIILKEGQSKNVTVTEAQLIEDNKIYTGIEILFDPEVYGSEEIEKNMLVQYGVSNLMTAEEAENAGLYLYQPHKEGHYFGVIRVSSKAYIAESHVMVADAISKTDGIEGVSVFYQDIPSALPIDEIWTIEDGSVASITESGGEPYSENIPILVNKTATVIGLKPGTTTLKVTRTGAGSITTECEVVVCMRGDVDINGEVNAEDALEVLKHVVKLKELSAESLVAGDLDEDDKVTAKDALDILRMVVGLE